MIPWTKHKKQKSQNLQKWSQFHGKIAPEDSTRRNSWQISIGRKQLQIQEFPDGGRQPLNLGKKNYYLEKILPKTAWWYLLTVSRKRNQNEISLEKKENTSGQGLDVLLVSLYFARQFNSGSVSCSPSTSTVHENERN